MGAQTKTRETFVIFRRSGSGRVQGKGTREQPLWDEHAAFMDKLFDAGKVMLAGPYADGSGALVIVEVEDESEARHIFDHDPWVVADILTAGQVKRWDIFWTRARSRTQTMNPADFIQRLPKAELHLHLEGALPWAVIREYVDEAPETPDWWAADYRYANFEQLNEAMRPAMQSVLKTVDRYHMVARQVFQILAAQNVRYVEISFGPGHALRQGLAVADVAAAVKQAAPDGLTARVFCGFNRERTFSLDDERVRAVFGAPELDGIDLHGVELPLTARPYADIFAQARQRGLMVKAHAGELSGATSVWDALRYLHVDRIEHGTRAIEDEALVDYLVEHAITLDMCPTSNLKLRVVDELGAHPIRTLFQGGVRVTVNTDDPTFFGCSLTGELHTLVDHIGFTLPELVELERNAFHAARLDDHNRAAIFAELDVLVAEVQ